MYKSGTSTAAPFAAGAAALYLQDKPGATPAEVKQGLLDIGSAGVVGNLGDDSPNRLLQRPTKPLTTVPLQEPLTKVPLQEQLTKVPLQERKSNVNQHQFTIMQITGMCLISLLEIGRKPCQHILNDLF